MQRNFTGDFATLSRSLDKCPIIPTRKSKRIPLPPKKKEKTKDNQVVEVDSIGMCELLECRDHQLYDGPNMLLGCPILHNATRRKEPNVKDRFRQLTN